MNDVLLRTGAAVLVALVGAGIGLAAGKTTRRVEVLVSAAAGALLAVTLVSLLPEAAHFLPLPTLLLAALAGYGTFLVTGRYVSPICPACAAAEGDPPAMERLRESAALLMVGLTLHSATDGAALAAGHALHAAPDLSLLLAVSLHKLPEGMALATLLLGAGHAPRTAFLMTAGVEAMTVLGGVLGALALADLPRFWLGALLAYVGGGFLYLVSHVLRSERPRQGAAPQIGYGILGFGSVAALLWGVGRLAH
jgi:zinc transporter ZupT